SFTSSVDSSSSNSISVSTLVLELQKDLDEGKKLYHAQQNRSFSKSEDQNQSFVPKDSEIEKEMMKRSGFYFQKPPAKRQKIGEVSGSVEEQSTGKEKEVSEEELKKLLVTVPVEKVYIEALHVKYPVIGWEVFTEESRSY
ncbi:hypothetical protein Tco_1557423, partial [Tanacetum coccineum]